MMYKGTETYHINSVETIEMFYPIRTDLDKLKYAVHITKIIRDVTMENQNSYKILQLYLNTLYEIAHTKKNLDLILCVFKIRLLIILGFLPQIKECVNCKTKENLEMFSIKDNGFKCKTCGALDKSSISINESTMLAIKYIIMAPPKKIFSFELKQESLKELEMISKIYFNTKLEKEYRLEELF